MKVVGIDPSMRNTAFAVADLNVDTGQFTILDLHLVETKDWSKANKTVRQNSIDLMKSRALHDHIEQWTEGASMAFVEMPQGSQSARAMASYGMCIGVIAAIKIPLIQVTPLQVKLLTVGDKTASKEDMMNWAYENHPSRKWLKRGGKLVLKNEHLADAVATIHAGLQTDEYRAAASLVRHFHK